MRAVVWLTVLCGIALATPARQRRSAGEEQKQKAAEDPGISPLEAILHKHILLSVPAFRGTISTMFKRGEFAEKRMGELLAEIAADLSDINQEKFKSLVSKWHTLKFTVLGTFDRIAFNLGMMSYYLYAGHSTGFIETRRCDHLKELIHAEDKNLTMMVEGVRKTTDCFIDILKEASKPGKIDCDSITEKEAIDMVFQLVQALHPLKLNGARALKTVEKLHNMTMEALKSKQANQGSSPGGQGGQVTTDKRIVELLRRYLEMKRGHGGKGGGKSGGGKGSGEDKSGGGKGSGEDKSGGGKGSGEDKSGGGKGSGEDKSGGGKGSGEDKSGGGKGSGESGQSSGENKDAKQEKPAPYRCQAFSESIAGVIQTVQQNVDRFSKIVDEMKQTNLTDDKLKELKTKWETAMHLAGNDIDNAMMRLAHIIHKLYLNTDAGEIKEVKPCELKIVTFSETITDEKDKNQTKDFTDALVKTVQDDAICVQELIDVEANLRSRLGDRNDSMPEDVAMGLINDFFKHLHQVRVTFARFFEHIERAAKPLVTIYMPENTEKRELMEMERELTQLMKKELAVDS